MAVFMRPFSSPFIGGFITMSYLGWRWTTYISAIMGFFGFGLCVLLLRETYAPAILSPSWSATSTNQELGYSRKVRRGGSGFPPPVDQQFQPTDPPSYY